MTTPVSPEALPEGLLDRARAALPDADACARDEIHVVTMTLRSRVRMGGIESIVYTSTFIKTREGGIPAWVLKQVTCRPGSGR